MLRWPLSTRVIAFATMLMLGAATAAASPRLGGPAPALAGETLDGNAFDLATLRGHVVIINIWATWCPPCRAEMPTLNAFYLRRRGEGVVLIGVSADRPHDEGDVRRAMHDLAYPTLIARQTSANGLGALTELPQTIVVDAAGIVRAVLAPTPNAPLSSDQLDAAVSPLLRTQRTPQ